MVEKCLNYGIRLDWWNTIETTEFDWIGGEKMKITEFVGVRRSRLKLRVGLGGSGFNPRNASGVAEHDSQYGSGGGRRHRYASP